MKSYEAERIRNIPESIFSTMSRLAFEHNAVNLGQGFPDFDGPRWIMEEAFKAMKSGKNQYAPSIGILSLRQQISDFHKKYYNMEWEPDSEVTVTAGATEALYCTIQAFIQAGDEVILFEPYYDAYLANVILAGGKPKFVTLHKPDFAFEKDELLEQISPSVKMIIINSPHNPTGKIFTLEELTFLANVAIENDLIVLSDEVYEFLTFDDIKHIPISTIHNMRERTITVSSAGKTFGMTGWKIGFITAQKKLTHSIRTVHQWTTFAVNTPGQHAIAYAFSQLDSYLPEFRELYQEKRDYIYAELKKTVFNPFKPNGSYFVMVEIPDGASFDDYTIAVELVKAYGIATIPPSVFYSSSQEGKSMLRLCFAKKDETLRSGIERLKNFKL